MKAVWLQVDRCHLGIRDLSFRRILSRIEDATNFEAGGGRGAGDKVDNGCMCQQGLASPILSDE